MARTTLVTLDVSPDSATVARKAADHLTNTVKHAVAARGVARIAISGDPNSFLERSSKIQWGLMVCVYCVSHVPALLMLQIPGYGGKNARLLFFLVVVVQLSDVLQYVWGKLLGQHKISPVISPSQFR